MTNLEIDKLWLEKMVDMTDIAELYLKLQMHLADILLSIVTHFL